MTTNHIWASVLVAVATILNAIQPWVQIIPQPWQALVLAIFGIAAFYHVIQSGTASALAKAGYRKL